MKAAYKKNRVAIVKEKSTRALNPREIRLRVEACGICGTDLASQEEEFVPFGHEIAGEVIELGAGVDYLNVGQKVVLDSATPCGRCAECRNMRQELCEDIQSFFYAEEFGLAEEMIAPAVSAIPYTGLDPSVALLQEPLGVAIDMVRLAEIGKDNNVLVIGQGPIGLMATTLSKSANARRVFVSDFKSKRARHDFANELGVDDFVDAESVAIEHYDFGCKIDRVLVTAPPPTLNAAFSVAAKGALISFIGIGHDDAAFCTFDVNSFHFRKLQLRASFASPALFGPLALSYLQNGTVPGERLISHRFALTDVQEALDTARNSPDALKVAVLPGGVS